MTIIEKKAEPFNEIRDGLFKTDQTGVITFVNKPLAEMHGFEGPEEMIGRHFSEFVCPEFRSDISEKFKKAIEVESYSEVLEFCTVKKNGDTIFIQLKHGPIVEKGQIIGTTGVIRDVTEQKQAEQALAASEKKYRTIVENMSDVVFMADQTGSLLFITPSVTRLLGYEQSEIIGHNIGEFIHKEDIHPALHNIGCAFSKKEPISNEYRILHKNGSILWMQTFTRPLFEGDEVVAVQGSFWDITKRKEAEEALKASEKKYRDLITNMREVLYTLDRDGRITFISPSVKAVTQYRVSEIIGHNIEELIFPEDLPRICQDIRNFLAGSGESAHEYRVVMKNGAIRWMRTCSSLLYEGEEIVGLQGILSDVTEHKRMEEALRESEEKFRSLVETTSDWIWEVDVDGTYTYASPRVYDLIGYTPIEVIGRKPFEFMPPDESARISAEYSRIARERKAFAGLENVAIRRDGRRVVLETSGVPMLDARGNLLGYRGIDRDITDRKHAEEVLKMSHDELELRVQERTAELEKRADQLAGLTSELTLAEQRERSRIAKILHDHLQQLLVGAKINQEVLMNEIADTSKSTARRVLDLINRSIREMRSLNAELAPPVLSAGDLSSSLEWLGRWMRENQGFEVKIQSGAPIVLDRKDLAVLVFQSIRELLLNVLKHAAVKSASVQMDYKDGNLRVVIRDRGVGFHPEHVWERAETGQKIGLISIRERLLHLGGHLEIESAPKEGTTVYLYVPLDKETSAEKNARDCNTKTPGMPLSTPAGPPRATEKIRVLLADDHPVMREGLSGMLGSHADIEVVGEAADGEEAVLMARDNLPDVILMDIRMPNMNGLEATRIIHSEFPQIRIIGLSMYDEEDRAASIIAAGASAYRSKSGHTDHLLAAIRGTSIKL